MYKPRTYRKWTKADDLVYFEVTEKDTDLAVYADSDLKDIASEAVSRLRRDLEAYIRIDPDFFSSLEPLELKAGAPEIARVMAEAAKKAGLQILRRSIFPLRTWDTRIHPALRA